MRKSIIIIIIYLAGCMVSYNCAKTVFIRSMKTSFGNYIYTKSDRFATIVVSLTSWFGAAIFSFELYVWPLINNEEAASW